MKISIVVPIYNVQDYIGQSLESIMHQDYDGDVECILVDDCGADRSMEIVEERLKRYNGRFEFRVIYHEHNGGLSAARNSGIKAASGDYILFVDSDDTITEDCLRVLSEPLKISNFDFVIGHFRYVCEPAIDIDFPLPQGGIFDREKIIVTFRRKWNVMAWNKLVNREFIVDNGLFFQERLLHEDELWSFAVACSAKSMYAVPKVTYNYLVTPRSIMTSTSSKKHFESYDEVLRQEVMLVKQHGLERNTYLYYLIEEAKRWRLREALEFMDSKDLLSYYMGLRDMRYCNPWTLPFDVRFSLRNYIRDLHYLMPTKLGCSYLKALNRLRRVRQ